LPRPLASGVCAAGPAFYLNQKSLAVSPGDDIDSALSLSRVSDTEDRPAVRGKVGYNGGLDVALPSPTLLTRAVDCGSGCSDWGWQITDHGIDDPAI
jgi:hypothetical protein